MPEPFPSPEVPSTPDVRERVKTQVLDRLNAMSESIDAGQRQRVIEMVQGEGMRLEDLKKMGETLAGLQRESRRNPEQVRQALGAMAETLLGTGKVDTTEIARLLPQSAQGAERLGGMVEKLSTMMNTLGEQMGGLGSGMMKTLEGFFGPDSFFGKVFAVLKNTPKAQAAYIEKKLTEQQKTLAAGTDVQQILGVLRPQIIQCQNIERRAKRAPTYDIVQHVEQLMAKIDATKTELTLEDFRVAGEQIIAGYPAEIAALPPPPEAASPAAERPKKVAQPSVDVNIAQNDATPLRVSYAADGVSLSVLSKTAKIEKILDTGISQAEVMDPTATLPGAVILTLADNRKIQIDATRLKTAAEAGTKQTVAARNLTNNTDMSIEIQFA